MKAVVKELTLAQNGASAEPQKSSDNTSNKTTQTAEEKPTESDSKATDEASAKKPAVEEETNGDPTGKGVQMNNDMTPVAEEAPKRRIRKKRDE